MSDTLVNPRSYVVGTVKENDPRFAGGKYYLAKLGGLQPVLAGVSDGMGEPGVPATAEGLPNRSEA